MPARRNLSIRTRIALLVVACVLPAWLATGFFTLQNYHYHRASIEESNQTAANSLLLIVERELTAAAASLQTLATSPSIDSRDLPALDKQVRQVLAQLRGLNILLIDLEGQQLLNTSRPLGAALPKEPHSKLMLRVLATAKPSVTDLFYGPVVKKHLVAMVVPVLRDGKVAAFLSLSMDAANLANLLDLQSYPPQWSTQVIDRPGNVIAHSRMAEAVVGNKAPPELLAAIGREPHGMVTVAARDGQQLRMAYHHSETHGWTASIAMPEADLTAELVKALWLQLAGATLFLLLGLVLANRIGRSIAQPIRDLVAPALALGQGRRLQLPELHLAEAHAVGQALLATQALLDQRALERDQARTESKTDGLTGIANRKRFDEALESEFARMRRSQSVLSLIMLDIDHFKTFNDTLGHPAGDACLRQIAGLIRRTVNRPSDLAARYGGEEFGMVLPDTTLQGATELANQIRQGIADLAISHPASSLANHVTVSLGVLTVNPMTFESPTELLRLADELLYQAKQQGRNRVVARYAE